MTVHEPRNHADPSGTGEAIAGERAALKLGRYEIVRELGKGAMGIVYLAKDPLIGRLVALKTIRTAAHADDDEAKEFQQRFVREAQAAGILNHPCIVTVHDIGQDESTGTSFIAMEYVEGHNLKEVLSQGRALTFDQIGEIAAQVADALDFAHSKGIVHRDVKPANIILVDGFRAKITDFGIAKIASGGANLTSTGQFLGTPNYMAPEQVKGAAVDGRSDLFSLGIVLYECLTRRKPFGGDSLTTISYRIVHESFASLHEINPQIPEGYEEIIAQALQKDPARRYQRGRDMANAIRAVIRGERPTRPEPLLADETVITRDREKLPTVEVPFPDAAADSTPNPARTQAAVRPAPVLPHPPPAHSQAPTRTVAPPKPSAGLRRSISALLFFGLIALCAGLFLGAVLAIQSKKVKVPVVDRIAEAKHEKERKLRTEGNEYLRQGRVDDAYEKYVAVSRLAPSSPAINVLLQKLSLVRQQQLMSQQTVAIAKQKLDQGVALYNQKKYGDAIPLLEESFHLNPSSEDAANYLKLAQIEQQKAANVPRRPSSRKPAANVVAGNVQLAATETVAGVAHLTTILNSPVGDGYIMVKADGQTIVHENLWEEKGRFFRRHNPRVVNVTHDVPAKSNDVEIYVVIPTMGINEHHTMQETFANGSMRRLLITLDVKTKKFEYQMY